MTLEELARKVARLEDTIAIYNLQSRYNFYLTMYWGERIADELFIQNDPEVSIADSVGLDAVREFFSHLDKVHRDEPGRMGSFMSLEPLVQVADDGNKANGQWFGFGPAVLPMKNGPKDEEHLEAMWMFGRYDIDYQKEDGQWKFKRFVFSMHFLSPVKQGWYDCPLPYSWRTFDRDAKSEKNEPPKIPDLYKPKGPNRYGPPPPDLK